MLPSISRPETETKQQPMLFSFLPSVSSTTRDLSTVSIPVNVNHSSSRLDYSSRTPMTREEFLMFVKRIEEILYNSCTHTTAFLQEVHDDFRGNLLCFLLFSQEMRCEFGWNHQGVYVSPIKYYPMFGTVQWSNQDYITVGDGLRHLIVVFRPVSHEVHQHSQTSICKSLMDALAF